MPIFQKSNNPDGTSYEMSDADKIDYLKNHECFDQESESRNNEIADCMTRIRKNTNKGGGHILSQSEAQNASRDPLAAIRKDMQCLDRIDQDICAVVSHYIKIAKAADKPIFTSQLLRP